LGLGGLANRGRGRDFFRGPAYLGVERGFGGPPGVPGSGGHP